MAFGYNNATLTTDNERAERRRQREAAMFGKPGTQRSGAVYPIDEKVNLPIELIDENPDNRKIFNMRHIEEFAESMDDLGFSGAIEVYQKEDGRYELISGNRRMLAMLMRGEKTIPAIIYPMPDNVFKAKKLLSANIHNRELTPLDYARAIEYYISDVLVPTGFKGDKYKACAKFFLKSETSIKRYMAISIMIPELQAYADDEQFPYTAFDKARTFSKEEQYELCDEIKKFQNANPDIKISQTYVEQIINHIKNKRQPEVVVPKEQGQRVERIPVAPEKKDESEQTDVHGKAEIEKTLTVTEESSTRSTATHNSSSEIVLHSVSAETLIRSITSQLCHLENETFEDANKESVFDSLQELKTLVEKLISKVS